MGLNGTWVNVPHPSKKINRNVSLRACVCTSPNLIVFYPDNGEWDVLAAKVSLVTETVPLWCEINFKMQRNDHTCSQHWMLFMAAFVMAYGFCPAGLGSALRFPILWGLPVLGHSIMSNSRSPPGSSVHGILQARGESWSGLPCPLPGDLPGSDLLHCRRILYRATRPAYPVFKNWGVMDV